MSEIRQRDGRTTTKNATIRKQMQLLSFSAAQVKGKHILFLSSTVKKSGKIRKHRNTKKREQYRILYYSLVDDVGGDLTEMNFNLQFRKSHYK